jgi:hypothetical protein
MGIDELGYLSAEGLLEEVSSQALSARHKRFFAPQALPLPYRFCICATRFGCALQALPARHRRCLTQAPTGCCLCLELECPDG